MRIPVRCGIDIQPFKFRMIVRMFMLAKFQIVIMDMAAMPQRQAHAKIVRFRNGMLTADSYRNRQNQMTAYQRAFLAA